MKAILLIVGFILTYLIVYWFITADTKKISEFNQEDDPPKEKPPVVPPKKIESKRLKLPPKCPVMRKTSFPESLAKSEAKRLRFRAYPCQFCPYWHLTHKKHQR